MRETVLVALGNPPVYPRQAKAVEMVAPKAVKLEKRILNGDLMDWLKYLFNWKMIEGVRTCVEFCACVMNKSSFSKQLVPFIYLRCVAQDATAS